MDYGTRLLRRLVVIVVVLLALLSGGVILLAQMSTTGSTAHCLTVQDLSGSDISTILLDTTRGRKFHMPATEGYTLGRVSPDEQYYAVTFLENDVMQLAFAPILENGRIGSVTHIRSGVISSASFYAPLKFMWSPDSAALIYLWGDIAAGQRYVSVYDMQTRTDTAYPLTRRDGDAERYVDFTLLGASNSGEVFGVGETFDGKPYYRFYTLHPLTPVSTPLDDVPLYDPVWSPQGDRLAALNIDRDGMELLISDLNATSLTIPLAISSRDIRKLVWSPDGNFIAIASIIADRERRVERWRFDLIHRDGSPAALDLYGMHITSVDLLPNVLPAMWHGEAWVWIEQINDLPVLVSLDTASNERTTLVRDLVRTRSVDMFYVGSEAWREQVFSPTPLYVSSSPRLVVPRHTDDGWISVDLLDLDTGEFTPVVSGAETLEALTLSDFSDLWSSDGRAVTVVWSTGHASTRRSYFTIYDLETGAVHTTSGDAAQIIAVSKIDETRYAFVNQTGSDYALRLLDPATGEEQEIAPLPPYSMSFQAALSPDNARFAVYASNARSAGGLGTMIVTDMQTSTVISENAITAPYWSPDGTRFAFLEYENRRGSVIVLSPEGERIDEFQALLAHYNPSLWLGGWSNCAVSG